MGFSITEIKKAANTVRIGITDSEAAALVSDMDGLDAWTAKLAEIKTDGVAPMISPLDFPLPRRTDTITDGDMTAAVLSNAPKKDDVDEFYLVPKILEA
ncbi:MAG: Asp-tRNA(Asn)/Glu-tRNA(Gln) amidotransferase subunit GatC [Alphaproteobacteria bacterium]|nr:Asp-tRNA(Asn)/Glu-tRNA(Gln) amidotransferase subunit GatC [Alphaproteobacteria bacterium]